MAELSERERDLLDLERAWWRYAGVKDAAIGDRLQMTTAEYHRELNRLIDLPAALRHDPLLVRRLRRMRLVRQRDRAVRRTGRRAR